MNLAFCLFKYFPYGGLQRDFIRIARECIRRGHQVDVYTMQWEGEEEPHLSIILLPAKGLQNHARIRRFAAEVQAHTARKQYDVVVGFNKMPGLDLYYAADTCFQAKANIQHGAWYRYMPRYKQLVAFEQAVFSKDANTHILHLTQQQQTEFVDLYQTPLERFHLLPPGIAKDRIAPINAYDRRMKLRKQWNIAENELLLLMVGSGFKTKGLDRAITAVASLPPDLKARAHLLVIGKDRPQSFQRQASKLGIADRVSFLGGRDDVPHFLLAADVLLHPAYNESAGMVLLEAIIAGLPVLTTDVCGYAHYVKEAKAGIVLDSPFTQSAFNQQLLDMLLSSERANWKKNGYLFAKQADIYNMPQHAVTIIESLRS